MPLPAGLPGRVNESTTVFVSKTTVNSIRQKTDVAVR
jgi:hypothetical protein